MLEIYVDEKLCKGCKYCITLCPTKVLALSDELGPKGYFPAIVKNPDACVVCRLCEIICPDFAVSIDEGES